MTDLVIRSTVSNLAQYISTNISTNLTNDQLTTILTGIITNYVNLNTPGVDIPLSGVSVDYETNKANLEAILTANPVWTNNVVAETGSIIIALVATALTYLQMSIVRAAQESILLTSRIASSIFANTRLLGVKIARKIPAQHPATIMRVGDLTSTLQINPYAQFSVSSNTQLQLFNRDALIFPIGIASISANLYEGKVGNITSFVSNGLPNQIYVLGEDDYSISDIDIVCTINGLTWTRTAFAQYFNIGFWEYNNNDTVFSDDSTADGNVEIRFGNGIFGRIPDTNSAISFSYVITSGQDGNIDLSNNNVTCNQNNNIAGVIIEPGVGGTNPLSANEYKSLGPGLYAAKYRGGSRSDHAAIARRYPGVIDAIFEGQTELAPADLRQMLIERCTLLTNTVWTDTDFANFKTWFENLDMANMRIYFNTPTSLPMDITVNVYCFDSASLTTVQNQILANLQANFVIESGVLGYKRAVSDIDDIIKRSNRLLIDYYDIELPTGDVTPTNIQYVTLGTVIINMFYTDRVRD